MSSTRVVRVQIDLKDNSAPFETRLETALNAALGAGPYLVVFVEKREARGGKETYSVWVNDNPLT